MSAARTLALAALASFATACATLPGRRDEPSAQRAWITTIVEASTAATSGEVARADSLVASYAQRYPEAPEANEALYWRALFKIDPANAGGSPAEAVQLLDRYLSSGVPATHTAEAVTLRRTAVALDSLARAAASARAAAESATAAGTPGTAGGPARPATPEEVQRLRDELARTQAELERIKRRLANPRP